MGTILPRQMSVYARARRPKRTEVIVVPGCAESRALEPKEMGLVGGIRGLALLLNSSVANRAFEGHTPFAVPTRTHQIARESALRIHFREVNR